MNSVGRFRALSVALLMLTSLASGCSRGDENAYGGFGKSAVPVMVAVAARQPVANELHEIGAVEPYSTVSVKSQVEAALTGVHFHEGDEVKKGDLLFTMDSRPFEAELARAEANQASDIAKFKQAGDEEVRWRTLLRAGVGSQERYDQARADADALRAAVEADKAAANTAQLNLGYCTISSPIDGRTGGLIVHEGNLVKADADTAMVVINQIKPVYVDFSVPEKRLAEIRAQASSHPLAVIATIPGQGKPAEGTLSFIDNQVDKTTGTIALKGIFRNADLRLWPGQFVDVSLKLGERPAAIVVPSQAVEVGQESQYVYVVGQNLTVQTRNVVAGDTVDGKTIIERGLNPGERVVTDGQLRLVPGARVRIKSALAGNQNLKS